MSREHGFTITELLVSTALTVIITGAALTTFKNGLAVNDTAQQLSDANQNLRAGTNQLIRDLMQAGRIIGPEGVEMPTGGGVAAFNRPGPPGSNLTFTTVDIGTGLPMNIPAITTGYQLGPTINGSTTDIVTLLTVDEFMPVITAQPSPSKAPNLEGTIAANAQMVTVPATSLWLTGDPANDTPPISVGDLVLFVNPNGNAMLTVTKIDTTHIYFAPNDANDWFHFNQFTGQVPILLLKGITDAAGNGLSDSTTAWTQTTSLFRAMMMTFYVAYDPTNPTVPPRLTRILDHYAPQALAGVVEDINLTYDLVDGSINPTAVTSLPYTDAISGVTYNSNEIRKVNVHIGVRSETISKPGQDYVRNHISTSVDVRSLASVDRYVAQ
jgi:type II secretory pathway pseudopilin PulG